MAAIIGAGIAAAAGLATSALGAQQANKFNKREAQKNRDFQQAMFSTRYQMTMADMKAAGLNPILAYKQGGGNPPGGSLARGAENIGSAGIAGASAATSSALGAIRQREELKNIEASRNLIKTQTEALQGSVSAARKAKEVYDGPSGKAYWLWNQSKGSGTLTRAIGPAIGLSGIVPGGPTSAKTQATETKKFKPWLGKVRRQKAPKSSGFSRWMKKQRRRVYGDERLKNFQRRGIQ